MPLNPNGDLQPQGLMMQRFSFGSSNNSPSSDRLRQPPEEDENEREALEMTLGELVVKCVHRLLWPGGGVIVTEFPNPDQMKDVLAVSLKF